MLCHSMLKDLKTVPKLTKRPKKTSNNLKLDELGGEEKKYLVLTLQELLKLNWTKTTKVYTITNFFTNKPYLTPIFTNKNWKLAF